MKELYDKLEYFVENSGSNKSIIATIKGEKAIAPFTTENKLMAYLLSIGAMTFQDYENLSHEFAKRYQEQNRYLDLFEMAPLADVGANLRQAAGVTRVLAAHHDHAVAAVGK